MKTSSDQGLHDHPNESPKLQFKRPHEAAWLIRINSINQELLLPTNGRLCHLMIIHEAGSTRQPTG